MEETAMNQSDAVGQVGRSSIHIATLCVCSILILFVTVLGSFGNGLILYSAVQCNKLRCNLDLLITNLAGVDLVICTVLAPIFLYMMFATSHSIPGELCASLQFMGMLCTLISLETLDVIAIHRQARVIRHIKASMSTVQALIVILCLWVVSLCVAVAGLLHLLSYWPPDASTCLPVINGPDRTKHNVVLFYMGPVCVLSFMIIILSYMVIACVVQKQSRVKRNAAALIMKKQYASPVLSNSFQPTDAYIQCNKANINATLTKNPPHQAAQFAMDKESKAMTMCLVVTVTVLLCWAPLITSQVIEFFIGESLVLHQVKMCGIALVFLNSALDPYVYAQHNNILKQKTSKLYQAVIACQCLQRCYTVFNKRTRLKAVGQGNLEENRNKSSHVDADTNILHIVSPHGLPKMIDQGVGPSQGHRFNYTPNSPLSGKCTTTQPRIESPAVLPHRVVRLPNGDHFVYSIQANGKKPCITSTDSRKSHLQHSSYSVSLKQATQLKTPAPAAI